MKYLITGVTGTFGRAFLSHLLDHQVERVAGLARHEKEIYEVKAMFCTHPHYSRFTPMIGDVRDVARLEMAMRDVDVVVHAAALKRIEIVEADPIEGVLTNVMGTVNVIEAALRAGVKRCILLSTDKAVAPVNLYGATKLVAERLFLAANNLAGGRCAFSVARYGNVWGSRGSVVHQWREQLKGGGPIKVTDLEATRYFMLPDEAVSLVMGLVADMRGGEIAIPDLPAYCVGDLVMAMRQYHEEYSGLSVDADMIGLPAWEKRHETLDGVTDSEHARRMTIEEITAALERIE